ncbi:MAG: hypothetical protein LBG09_01965 [Puniceicoccales bacterium]|jgi:hypothetical protein|nr:hypothetical protein [Puniceicoccales bacterium]
MFRAFRVRGIFGAVFFAHVGSIDMAALQQLDYARPREESAAKSHSAGEKLPATRDLPPNEPLAIPEPSNGEFRSDLQSKPEILKISECDQKTRGAWKRFGYIVEKFPCKRGDSEYRLLEALLREHPTLLWAADDRGQSLLVLAIFFRRAEVVALLLFAGCAFETRDAQGNTPLLLAIQEKFTDAIVLLLTYGADPDARNNDGFNAIQLAFAKDCTLGAVVLKYSPHTAKPPDKRNEKLTIEMK